MDVADGLRVQPPRQLIERVREEWDPLFIVCDRFKVPELRDHASGIRVVPRVTRCSESTADIRALRRMAGDGPLNIDHGSRSIIEASLAVSTVKNDDAGSVRLVKRGTNNQSRDDVSAAWLLAAGATSRFRRGPGPGRFSAVRRDRIGPRGFAVRRYFGSAHTSVTPTPSIRPAW